MIELTHLNLTQILNGLRKGDFSCQELIETYLSRIQSVNPGLHAYLYIAGDDAKSRAADADDQLTAWRSDHKIQLPPLLGVPIAVKDVLCVAGMPCTCGSRILENFIPSYSATAVRRLLDAGAIVLGKTNTDEFAMGSSTENSAFGATHNPWDYERVPGGSSGGSAAAVSARLAPLALGTDTGGSVRHPASFCGITALKPTYGRVSRYGLVAFGSSLDTVGTFARSVDEVAAVYQVLAGHDPKDATTMDLPVPVFNPGTDLEPRLDGLRIGVPMEYFIPGMQPAVEAAVMKAIDVYKYLGATLTPISLPHTEYALPVYYLIAPAEASANLARYDGVRYSTRSEAESMWDVFFNSRGENFGPEVKRRIMIGTYALSAGYHDAYYTQAQKVRTLIRRDFELAFNQVDLIAAPVTPTTAFRLGEHTNDPLSMYLEDVCTLPANLAGIPGLAFPVGQDQQNMPIGMQLMAPHFQENRLFQAGHAYQRVTNWHLLDPNAH